MRVTQQPAFVLHRYPYGETSLIVELLTRDHGRVGVLAKGARRPLAQARARLSPFQPLLAGLSGRGELPVLTQIEAPGPGFDLSGEALWCGFYVNELLLRLLPRHDAHEGLHVAYAATLARLAVGDAECALRVFEKRLLQELGYGLLLETDVLHRPVDAGADYVYVLECGPVPVAEASQPGIPLRGASLLALARERLEDMPAREEAKRLLRAAFTRHLGERPLHTRALFQRLRTSKSTLD